MLVIIYTVAANGARWASRLALIGGLCAGTLSQLRWPTTETSGAGSVFIAIFQTVPFALAWVLGDSIRTRRAYLAQLEERAARLEKEREAQAKVAVAAERARIARELHDVVAHNVSVMVVQADGAAYVMDTAPDQAKKALETISGTGRQALAEMRRLLGVLRTGEHQESGEYVPQPDVEQLDDLIEQCRTSGLPVDFKVEGTPRPLPSGVELTAYRIVQEALTNTRKHGGPNAGASVRLVYFDDGLGLLVEDDGKGAPHELYEEGGADGQGHGLIGMRERVGMVGGTLDAGPRPGGGFRISALLPLKPAH
jgi:signal transduction histidine kinase